MENFWGYSKKNNKDKNWQENKKHSWTIDTRNEKSVSCNYGWTKKYTWNTCSKIKSAVDIINALSFQLASASLPLASSDGAMSKIKKSIL